MTRFSVAKELVVTHLDELVPELFGSGRNQTRMAGGRWEVANKWRHGAHIGQMSVWRQGASRGAWKDFAGTGQGDAIDLVAYALNGLVNRDTRMTAVEWIENRFGVKEMDPATKARIHALGEANRIRLNAEASQRSAASRTRARKAFYAADPTILGTPVETYARTRGVELSQVPHLTHSFRYRRDGDYWPARPRDDAGKAVGKAPQFEVMMSAMADARGQLGAVHYTFLEPGGTGKLKTEARGYYDVSDDGEIKPWSAKLMFPETMGMVVRVTWGPSGLSCEAAAEAGIAGWIGLTEGIEDAWSIGISDPELRMHAAGSLSGYLHVPDHAAAKGYLLFRDNDWDKPQAVALFDQALARIKSFGKPVEAVAMPAAWGKDANDVLNWKG